LNWPDAFKSVRRTGRFKHNNLFSGRSSGEPANAPEAGLRGASFEPIA